MKQSLSLHRDNLTGSMGTRSQNHCMGSFDWKRESDPPLGITGVKCSILQFSCRRAEGTKQETHLQVYCFIRTWPTRRRVASSGGEGYAGVCFYSRKESTVSVYVIVNPAAGVWNFLLEILSFSVLFWIFNIKSNHIRTITSWKKTIFSRVYVL